MLDIQVEEPKEIKAKNKKKIVNQESDDEIAKPVNVEKKKGKQKHSKKEKVEESPVIDDNKNEAVFNQETEERSEPITPEIQVKAQSSNSQPNEHAVMEETNEEPNYDSASSVEEMDIKKLKESAKRKLEAAIQVTLL